MKKVQYRIVEKEHCGDKYFYPQYKSGWFWRNFKSPTSERVYTTCFYLDMGAALRKIESDKEKRREKKANAPIYHTIN